MKNAAPRFFMTRTIRSENPGSPATDEYRMSFDFMRKTRVAWFIWFLYYRLIGFPFFGLFVVSAQIQTAIVPCTRVLCLIYLDLVG